MCMTLHQRLPSPSSTCVRANCQVSSCYEVHWSGWALSPEKRLCYSILSHESPWCRTEYHGKWKCSFLSWFCLLYLNATWFESKGIQGTVIYLIVCTEHCFLLITMGFSFLFFTNTWHPPVMRIVASWDVCMLSTVSSSFLSWLPSSPWVASLSLKGDDKGVRVGEEVLCEEK